MVDIPNEIMYNNWIEVRTLWPKRCCVSGKTIPMYSIAYCKFDPYLKSELWALKEEFIMARLKGKI